jgi:alpha-ketoglutarate-dependent taurine dioxygenase
MGPSRIRALTRAIGAEVEGLDLREPLDDATRAQLHAALDRHLVLRFRGQPLAPEELLAFGRRLGTLRVHPFAPHHADHPELVVIDQVEPEGEGADEWHADATFLPDPPRLGVLQAVRLPEVGGDTLFASAIAAYEALSAPLRGLLAGLRAVHDLSAQLRGAIERGKFRGDLRAMQERWPPFAHPVVRVQPASGRGSLFVNRNYTTRIEGLAPDESEALLALLLAQLRSPKVQLRVRWEPHTVVVWDNHFAQHFAVPDYRERRVMHRLNLSSPTGAGDERVTRRSPPW